MMTNTTDIVQKGPELIAFGDLAASECLDSLQGLLHSKNNANLSDFFVRVSFGLRQFLGCLPSTQQHLFPRFSTLVDLLDKWECAPGRPALQLFLLSVLQSAQFIQLVTHLLTSDYNRQEHGVACMRPYPNQHPQPLRRKCSHGISIGGGYVHNQQLCGKLYCCGRRLFLIGD